MITSGVLSWITSTTYSVGFPTHDGIKAIGLETSSNSKMFVLVQSDLPWVSVSVAIEASVVVMVVEVSAVVITSIGFRLCQGSGGKSENYDLKKDTK